MALLVWQNVLLQLLYFVAVVFVFGYVISFLNKLFYRLVGYGKGVCYITGIIGTPIHELSHAIMCVAFFHKIDEMRLFRIDRENGTLGYVKHSYNNKNPYHVLGNFFIGTAPIVMGTLVIFLLIKLMLPSAFLEIEGFVLDFANAQESASAGEIASVAASSVLGIMLSIFSCADFSFAFFGFVILSLCIALHMNMSKMDMKGAFKALPILIILVVVLNFTMAYVFEQAYPYYVDFMETSGRYLSAALLLSFVFSLLSLCVAFVVRAVYSIISKIF